MAKYCSECGLPLALRELAGEPLEAQISEPPRSISKKKRKPSKYNKEYSKQFKKLKKKHPRTAFKTLAKRAHTATKRVMK